MVVLNVLDNYYLAITLLITGHFPCNSLLTLSGLPASLLRHSMDPPLRQAVRSLLKLSLTL